jgi:hypothetical protein
MRSAEAEFTVEYQSKLHGFGDEYSWRTGYASSMTGRGLGHSDNIRHMHRTGI